MPGCEDPKGCLEKAEHLREYLARVLHMAEERWEELKQQRRKMYKTKHLISRMKERAVSEKDLMDVIEYGWPIEYFVTERELKETFTVIGYTRSKRPLHLIVTCEENKIYLTTVYDPRSMPWRWDGGYQVRKCFCKSEEEDV